MIFVIKTLTTLYYVVIQTGLVKYVKTNKINCAPSEYSDQPERPRSLIRVFAICVLFAAKLRNISSDGQRRLMKIDPCQSWAHMSFCLIRYATATCITDIFNFDSDISLLHNIDLH